MGRPIIPKARVFGSTGSLFGSSFLRSRAVAFLASTRPPEGTESCARKNSTYLQPFSYLETHLGPHMAVFFRSYAFDRKNSHTGCQADISPFFCFVFCFFFSFHTPGAKKKKTIRSFTAFCPQFVEQIRVAYGQIRPPVSKKMTIREKRSKYGFRPKINGHTAFQVGVYFSEKPFRVSMDADSIPFFAGHHAQSRVLAGYRGMSSLGPIPYGRFFLVRL